MVFGVGFLVASLADLNSRDCPDEAAFYVSGRAVNESAFLFQLFARMLGTNNLPDCSNLCHESSGAALTEALGTGKSTVTLADLEAADCIVVAGSLPSATRARSGSREACSTARSSSSTAPASSRTPPG